MTQERRTLREIQRALMQGLRRRGALGELKITATQATLHGRDKTSAALGSLVNRWGQLPRPQRDVRVGRICQELWPAQAPVRSTRGAWMMSAAILLLTTVIGSQLVLGITRGRTDADHTPTPLEDERKRQARARRVCEATESRVMRGGTAGPTDYEGWVTELTLVRPVDSVALAQLGNLQPLIAQAASASPKISWQELPALVRTETDAKVELVEHVRDDKRLSTVVLHGAYVRSYFREQQRIYWLRFATALAKAVDAEFGGLYAHCSHRSAHQIGSWFSGSSMAGASAALLYFMGAFQDAPVLTKELQSYQQRPALLEELMTRVGSINKSQLTTWLADDGGMVSGSSRAKFAAISFPYRDSNRAARASRRLARSLDLTAKNEHGQAGAGP